jgi:hypothetical protein
VVEWKSANSAKWRIKSASIRDTINHILFNHLNSSILRILSLKSLKSFLATMGSPKDTEMGIDGRPVSVDVQRTATDNDSTKGGQVSDTLYLDPVAERSYVRKLDMWLLPVLAIM